MNFYLIENCDPYKCAVEKVFRSNVLSLENAIRDPCNQIGGLVVLLDMAGIGFAHAKFLSPHLAKRTVEVIQEAFPMRFKAFHILHEPFYFDAILAILRPFLKEKIRRRVRAESHINTSRAKINHELILYYLHLLDNFAWTRSHIVAPSHSKGGFTGRIRRFSATIR